MNSWDVIIIGGGIVGLSLSMELRRRTPRVLIIERGEPGREASHAAAGMLADYDIENSSPLKPLAVTSAQMYPEFVHELQDESGVDCDLRQQGTLKFVAGGSNVSAITFKEIEEMHPDPQTSGSFIHLNEGSVDPRALSLAAVQAAKRRKVDIVSGSEAREVMICKRRVTGVRTDKAIYPAPIVVNCAGAWSGQLSPIHLPTRPVKGQLLSVLSAEIPRYVIRSPEVYLVPRSDGRLLIGSTLEEAGYDKRTDPNTIRKMHHRAINLCPFLQDSRILEAWAGLRPATPDSLPVLGATSINGYFVATGHFRDGILLAPITARLMAQIITGHAPDYDLSAFSISRFGSPVVN